MYFKSFLLLLCFIYLNNAYNIKNIKYYNKILIKFKKILTINCQFHNRILYLNLYLETIKELDKFDILDSKLCNIYYRFQYIFLKNTNLSLSNIENNIYIFDNINDYKKNKFKNTIIKYKRNNLEINNIFSYKINTNNYTSYEIFQKIIQIFLIDKFKSNLETKYIDSLFIWIINGNCLNIGTYRYAKEIDVLLDRKQFVLDKNNIFLKTLLIKYIYEIYPNHFNSIFTIKLLNIYDILTYKKNEFHINLKIYLKKYNEQSIKTCLLIDILEQHFETYKLNIKTFLINNIKLLILNKNINSNKINKYTHLLKTTFKKNNIFKNNLKELYIIKEKIDIFSLNNSDSLFTIYNKLKCLKISKNILIKNLDDLINKNENLDQDKKRIKIIYLLYLFFIVSIILSIIILNYCITTKKVKTKSNEDILELIPCIKKLYFINKKYIYYNSLLIKFSNNGVFLINNNKKIIQGINKYIFTTNKFTIKKKKFIFNKPIFNFYDDIGELIFSIIKINYNTFDIINIKNKKYYLDIMSNTVRNNNKDIICIIGSGKLIYKDKFIKIKDNNLCYKNKIIIYDYSKFAYEYNLE